MKQWWKALIDKMINDGRAKEEDRAALEKEFAEHDPGDGPPPQNPAPAAGGSARSGEDDRPFRNNGNVIDELRTELRASNAKNEKLLEMIGDMKKRQDDGEAAMKAKAEADRKKEVETKVEEAVKSGRIAVGEKEQWSKDLLENFELASRILDKIPGNGSDAGKGDGGTNKGGEGDKAYEGHFARSIPKEFMQHVEQSVGQS